jgi:hypothetical protein
MGIVEVLKKIWRVYDRSARSQLTEAAEYELIELEHIFGLLTMGSFVGLPSPPLGITLDLMPVMEQHLILMSDKVDTASAPLSDLASIFEVG